MTRAAFLLALALLVDTSSAPAAAAADEPADIDVWAVDRFDFAPPELPGDRPPAPGSEELAAYQAAAESGNRDAQSRLGVMYRTGRGVPQSDRRAFEWFRKAALAGDPAAQHYLGLFYLSGAGTEVDLEEATRWLRRCAEINEPETLLSLAWFTLDDNHLPHAAVHTAALLRNLAELGTSSAQYALGALRRSEADDALDDASLVWLGLAAESGHVRAQLELGAALLEASNTPEEAAAAATWFRRAAEQGSARAMRNLGVARFVGRGVERDTAIAFRWFWLAERFGDEVARKDVEHLAVLLGPQAHAAARTSGLAWQREHSLEAPQTPMNAAAEAP
jgi:TPR repeat protein